MLAFGNIIRLSAIVKGGLIVALFLFLLIFRYLYRRRYEAVNKHKTFLKAGYGEDLDFESKRGIGFEAIKLKRQRFDGSYQKGDSGYLFKVVNQKKTLSQLFSDREFLAETLGRKIVDIELKRSRFSQRKKYLISFDNFKNTYFIKDEKRKDVFMYGNSSNPISVDLGKVAVTGIFTQTGGGKTVAALTLMYVNLRRLLKKYPHSKPRLIIGSSKLNDFSHLKNYKDRFDCYLYDYNEPDDLKRLNNQLEEIINIKAEINKKLSGVSFGDRDDLEKLKEKHEELRSIEIDSAIICLDEVGTFSSLKAPPRIDTRTKDEEVKQRYFKALSHHSEKVRFVENVTKLANTIRYLGIKMIYINQIALQDSNILHGSLINLKFYARVSSTFSKLEFGSDIASSSQLKKGRFITKIENDDRNERDYRQIKFAITNPEDFSKL